jgi:hypothetical protein
MWSRIEKTTQSVANDIRENYMANGLKDGAKNTGSVADLHGSDKVDRHETSHNVKFAEGGNTPMFGEQAAGEQKAGTTAHDVGGGAPGAEFAKGGSGKMFGYQGSVPARDGITSAR